MKSISISILFCCASPFLHAQFFDSLSAPSAWYRADQSKLAASQWSDVSGKNNHATYLTGQSPAEGGVINFNKALVFDGIDDYFKVPVNLEGLPGLTIINVFQSADTIERGTWGSENALSRKIYLTTRRALGPDSIADQYGKNENRTILSTIEQHWEGTPNTSATAFLALGSAGKSRSYKSYKGLLAESLVFSRTLDYLERLQIETYLAIKYSAALENKNYINSNENVIWNAEENKDYAAHITCIGRDDAFKLYQKQSQSSYDSGFLTISAGPLAASNESNTTEFATGNFLIWGDNNGSYSTRTGQDKDSVLSLMQRHWMLNASGNSSRQINTEVRIDLSRMQAANLGYWLVVDRSGQGNFSVDNLEYIDPVRVSNGFAIYNIKWDTDGSGKDCFSFARARSLFAVVRKLNDPLCTNETAGKIRIEFIKGHAPFNYKLTGGVNKISRDSKTSETTNELKELMKGDYVLALSDGSGEALTRNFSLIMPDGIDINLGEDQKLTPNNRITLDVKDQVPTGMNVSYLWESSFGFNSNESKIAITESGIYKVTVTKQSDGCQFSDAIAISGTDEEKVAVFPTIVNRDELFNISVSLPESGNVEVQLYDLKGTPAHVLKGSDSPEHHFKTSLSNSGMYLIMVRTPNGTQTKKVIIK